MFEQFFVIQSVVTFEIEQLCVDLPRVDNPDMLGMKC